MDERAVHAVDDGLQVVDAVQRNGGLDVSIMSPPILFSLRAGLAAGSDPYYRIHPQRARLHSDVKNREDRITSEPAHAN
ncbi:MAG: hypothetical protein ACRD3Q_13540, partial [Terriglobales bacterium]